MALPAKFGPLLGQTRVDKILSQFSQMYRNMNFICELILPVMKVKEKTGLFAKYGTENLRVYTQQLFRAPGTRSKQMDYSVSQGSYSCKERSIEKLVPDEFVQNQDDPYDAKRDAVQICMDVIWGNQELNLATSLGDTGVLTNNTTLSGTSQWSDYVNSTPITDIEVGIQAVRSKTGARPNTFWMSHPVFTKLKYHPDIRNQVRYTNGGQLSDQQMGAFLKDFFNVENVFVGMAIYNSAALAQTDVITDIWGKNFTMAFQTPGPTLMKATFGYTFFDVPRVVDTYREEPLKSDVVRQRYSYDQNIMDANLAYLIKNAIA